MATSISRMVAKLRQFVSWFIVVESVVRTLVGRTWWRRMRETKGGSYG